VTTSSLASTVVQVWLTFEKMKIVCSASLQQRRCAAQILSRKKQDECIQPSNQVLHM
jgi:hypothetical protein